MTDLDFITAAMALAATHNDTTPLEHKLFDEMYDGFLTPPQPAIDEAAGPRTTPDQDWSAE